MYVYHYCIEKDNRKISGILEAENKIHSTDEYTEVVSMMAGKLSCSRDDFIVTSFSYLGSTTDGD